MLLMQQQAAASDFSQSGCGFFIVGVAFTRTPSISFPFLPQPFYRNAVRLLLWIITEQRLNAFVKFQEIRSSRGVVPSLLVLLYVAQTGGSVLIIM